jgi:tetratricopeptide (TPR) repeat protein
MAEIVNEPAAPEFAGSFEAMPFARIFFQLVREKKTGLLDIYTQAPPEGKVVKRLAMQSGSSFFIQGGSAEETLARILVARGRLSEERYQALKDQAVGDYKKLDEIAPAEAGLNGQELADLYQYQTELKIENCFALVRGYYIFRDSDSEALRKFLLMQVKPEKVMLEGVIRHYPKGRVSKEYAGIEKKTFKTRPDLAQNINAFGLGPKEQRWLRGLAKEFVFGSAAQQSGLKSEDAVNILLSLYLAGYLELPPEQEDFPLGKAYAGGFAREKKAEEKKLAADKKVEEKKEEARKEAKKEDPKLPIEEMLDKEMSNQELLVEIDKLLAKIHQRETTFFDIMGVNPQTTSSQIKKIYFKMAKVFHPDAKPDLYQGEVRDKVEDLFTKIGEAYNTLTDGELRKQYSDRLKSTVSDEEMEKANKVIQAEMEFQKATIDIRRGSFKEALVSLDKAASLVPDEQEYKIYQGYCIFKTQGLTAASKASKMIEEGLKERPKVAEGWYYLGVINRVHGELEKARVYFQKALDLDKYHQEAQRELRVVDMKLAEEPKKGKKKK